MRPRPVLFVCAAHVVAVDLSYFREHVSLGGGEEPCLLQTTDVYFLRRRTPFTLFGSWDGVASRSKRAIFSGPYWSRKWSNLVKFGQNLPRQTTYGKK